MGGTPIKPAVVVMGVAGAGKTGVGEALAALLNVPFRDADEFHPPSNVAKMSAGTPLVDEDRWPWLDAIAAALADAAPGGIVVACSALKRVYRDRLRAGAKRPVMFIHLDGPRDLLAGRIGNRRGHFMPASLLDSQIATLEPLGDDEGGFTVSVVPPVREIAESVARRLTPSGQPA